jgi:hypothetical protein
LPSTSQPIGTPAPKAVIPMEIQTKKGKITKLTMNNNVIHDTQKGQVRTIMTYDIPTAWSHDLILDKTKIMGLSIGNFV